MNAKNLIAGALVLGASTIGGLVGYGTYGYLKDKKKMSSWKAGAATGAITGALAMVLTMVGFGPYAQTSGVRGMGQLSAGRRQVAGSRRRLAAARFPVLQNMGALVVEQLRGCASCG